MKRIEPNVPFVTLEGYVYADIIHIAVEEIDNSLDWLAEEPTISGSVENTYKVTVLIEKMS